MHMIELEQLKRIIEAALLAAGNPLSTSQLLALFDEQQAISHDEISRTI